MLRLVYYKKLDTLKAIFQIVATFFSFILLVIDVANNVELSRKKKNGKKKKHCHMFSIFKETELF